MKDFSGMTWDEMDEAASDMEPVGRVRCGLEGPCPLYGARQYDTTAPAWALVIKTSVDVPCVSLRRIDLGRTAALMGADITPLDDGARAVLAELLLLSRADPSTVIG